MCTHRCQRVLLINPVRWLLSVHDARFQTEALGLPPDVASREL